MAEMIEQGLCSVRQSRHEGQTFDCIAYRSVKHTQCHEKYTVKRRFFNHRRLNFIAQLTESS